jgi:hypothetical protein
MNNILTWFGVMITFLTIFIAVAGWIAYDTFKKNVEKQHEEMKNELRTKLSKYDELISLKNSLDNYNNVYENKFRVLNEFTDTAFKSVHSILFSLAQKQKDKNLNNELFHSMKIFNLYSFNKIQKIDSWNYFRYKGAKADLPLLNNVVKNETDEEVKELAIKTIGIIENNN